MIGRDKILLHRIDKALLKQPRIANPVNFHISVKLKLMCEVTMCAHDLYHGQLFNYIIPTAAV